jgi:TolA-binding protein
MIELEEYMRTKFKVLDFESDDSYQVLDQAAHHDVQTFITKSGDDKFIHDYLGLVFPYQKSEMAAFIKSTEEECKAKGLYELTNTWIDELKEKDPSIEYVLKGGAKPELPEESFKIKARTTGNVRKILIRSISIAASITLLIGFLLWLNRAPENERIFAEYHPEPIELSSLTTRSENFEVNVKFENALNLYRNSKYTEAANLFQVIYESDHSFGRALYYEGVCQFEAGSYNQAIYLLETVILRFD